MSCHSKVDCFLLSVNSICIFRQGWSLLQWSPVQAPCPARKYQVSLEGTYNYKYFQLTTVVEKLYDIYQELILLQKKVLDVVTCEQCLKSFQICNKLGSAITNGREPGSCLSRVFNFKLGSLSDNTKIVQLANGHF